ncbi:MAG: DUF2891 domain-containing protein [Sphingobacterium sp.]
MIRRTYLLILFALIVLVSCRHNEPEEIALVHPGLSIDLAKKILALPVGCLQVEYPNKLGQVLGHDSDLKPPRALRPVFYGCFDWHSSVHGYWSIVKLLKQFPELDLNGEIRQTLSQHITPENIQVEMAFFEDENNLNFERTYGWAWLFKLQEELISWNDPDAKDWSVTLQPLVDLFIDRYRAYLPKLVYPIRAGQHDNSAFSLSLSLDYAKAAGREDFYNLIRENSMRLYQNDQGCDLSYEPSGYDFLSPCLEEAYLMSKVLDRSDFMNWLANFMPALGSADFQLDPTLVKDRSDGKLVHLDGLNYSRAACLYGLSVVDDTLVHLQQHARTHFNFSIENLSNDDDYMGSHWLGTFALYALAHAELVSETTHKTAVASP